MAQQLEISRASVHNALREVEIFGLTLYRVRGRGYCLVDPPQWLDAAHISRHLGKRRKQFHLTLLDSAPSSNTLMMQNMAQAAPSGSVLAVEWQTGGRGRMGRTWHSGLGSALTFSLLWRFDCGLAGLSGLSLAVGVALIRALRCIGIEGARLKWPNDVLDINGAKLAGILIEAQGEMQGPSAVVIGVGLNLSLPPDVSRQLDRAATGLAEMCGGKAPDRNRLLAVLLLTLGDVLQDFAARGFAAIRAEWQNCHALQDMPVSLALPDGSRVTGIARGVTDDGALNLETSRGMQIFHAGDISLIALNSNSGVLHAAA